MLNRFLKWLEGYFPAWCQICGRVMFTKDVRYAQHRVAGMVPVCTKCHTDLYGE
ncbi:hypothetical protein ANRL4_04542 [Anaerolineae bacterium]|nr:hypothetical protein ANRL4_04542 [Anaerolineae bacterium]